MHFSAEQPSNAEIPIEVTLFGISMYFSAEQPSNAEIPIEVTLFGMSMLFRAEHPSNAASSIVVMPSGIIASIIFLSRHFNKI